MKRGEDAVRNDTEATEELAAELEDMRVIVVLLHRLRVQLAAAAIDAHIEKDHHGPWLALPEGTRCLDTDCMEYSGAALEADAWLDAGLGWRDWLDILPLGPNP